jgi:uncharacterized protein (TIGR04255 family)
MPFPDIKRMIYKKNPLDKVICQLQFPPNLKIDTEIPALFQEKNKKNFPIYSETNSIVNIPNEINPAIPKELIDHVQRTHANYEFSSENGDWKINLTRTFIALTCNNYQRWESFKEMLDEPLKTLESVYSPPFFTRIGLRYIDVIRRSALNLIDTDWDELFQPYILGLLNSKDIKDRIKTLDNNHEILLSDDISKVKIMTKFVNYIENDELCFMIDSDFYLNKRIELSDSREKLDFFNKRASRLIRWCITDKLHEAMEPNEI